MRYFKDRNNKLYAYEDNIKKIKKGLEEISFTEYKSFELFGVFDKTDMEIKTEIKKRKAYKAKVEKQRKIKREGKEYNGYKVPFTSKDAIGMMQVKMAFDTGLRRTTIHFSNGTKMRVTSSTFDDFAKWFVKERAKFFED